MPAQADHITIVPVAAGEKAGEDQAVDRQGFIAGIQAGHVHAQIGVGVAYIGRVGQRAGDQHLVLPVVVPGNVVGINTRNGEMVTGRAEEENSERRRRGRRWKEGAGL